MKKSYKNHFSIHFFEFSVNTLKIATSHYLQDFKNNFSPLHLPENRKFEEKFRTTVKYLTEID